MDSGSRVSVQVRYEAERSARPLHYVAVISGGDKHHWYDIPAGKTRRVTVRPGDTDDTGITLFFQYAADDERRVWQGPDIPGGLDYAVSGFAVELPQDTVDQSRYIGD